MKFFFFTCFIFLPEQREQSWKEQDTYSFFFPLGFFPVLGLPSNTTIPWVLILGVVGLRMRNGDASSNFLVHFIQNVSLPKQPVIRRKKETCLKTHTGFLTHLRAWSICVLFVLWNICKSGRKERTKVKHKIRIFSCCFTYNLQRYKR